MDKEKEIEDMAKELHCATNESFISCRKIARILVERRGYGNVKQAVKEFLYKIENLLIEQENRYSRLCASKRTLLNLHKKITELYGADE